MNAKEVSHIHAKFDKLDVHNFLNKIYFPETS